MKTFPRQQLKWSVGFCNRPNEKPQRRVPAVVPGAVQLDWATAEDWQPWWYADNWRQYGWMEDVQWSYVASLDFKKPQARQRLFFVCKGVDYRFAVRLNGRTIHEQEGMFTPFEIDLTDLAAKGDELEIVVFGAPKTLPNEQLAAHRDAGRVQANQSCKPAVSYGWDFHPRLIPLGIWDETYLEVRPACHIRSAEVRYDLREDLSAAEVRVQASLSQKGGGKVRWRLLDPAGRCVVDQRSPAGGGELELTASLARPQLWWPNGQGKPALYTSIVELMNAAGRIVQTCQSRVGFRRVRLVMNAGAWEQPKDFPKTRSTPPITLEINGREIFCKGSNWVCPDVFPGTMTAGRYREHLDLVAAANMNLLRCWGGAIVNKDAFFDLCDERGIMVWQEFPLACNRYEATPAYLRVLDQESQSIIRRLSPHASVVLWCGGNELFNVWSGMTDQDLALRLLNRNCYDLDPSRPFIMTSPLMGMGHGHYVFRSPEGREVFQIFADSACTAYTEFGCPAPASVEVLKSFIPPEQLFPPRPATPWQTHHAFNAWQENSHLLLDVMEGYFGPGASLADVVDRGQLLQAEGLRCIFEEARRQKPRASMALNWCFNEPWPTAANMSIVNWPTQPKPAYHAVTAALRPALASARIPKFTWNEGELFRPELYILNDSPKALAAGRIEAHLQLADHKLFLLGWDFPSVPANTNLPGPVIQFALPGGLADRMELVLDWGGAADQSSRYTLLYKPKTPQPAVPQVRNLNQ